MAEQAPEHQDRGLFGLFGKKNEEEGKHEDKIMQPTAAHTHSEPQTEASSYYPTAAEHGIEHCQGHSHEGQLTPEEAEQQKHASFGLFGKKTEEEGKHEDKIMHPSATHTLDEAQTEAASYYPSAPEHGVEHCQGHGHEGQLTPEEAEQQKHAGFLGKVHRTHSSSSSSSSNEEEEDGKKKEAGRKKKDAKDKIKKKLPGDGQHSSDQCGSEEEKKAGLVDKIKKKLPGQRSSDQCGGEEEKKAGLVDKIKEKLPAQHSSDQFAGEEEKKAGLLDKIKEKLPAHPNKKEEEDEEEKKAGLLDKIKAKLPGRHNKKEGEEKVE